MRTVQILLSVPTLHYGSTPYQGQPLYRVVFSDSRTDLVGGKWPDGNCEYREAPRYPGIRGQWVLEKWLSAQDYAGSREQYEREQWDAESGLLTCGPYPNRGEYVLCYVFPCVPGDSMVYNVVCALKLSRDVTPGQRKQGIMEPLEKQQQEREQRFDDIWGEAMGPFAKAEAVVSLASSSGQRAGFKRGSDMPADKWGEAAPLPTRDGFFGQIRREETIAKLTGDVNAES